MAMWYHRPDMNRESLADACAPSDCGGDHRLGILAPANAIVQEIYVYIGPSVEDT